jgi:hypothetical protein
MTWFVQRDHNNPFVYPESAAQHPYRWLVAFYKNGGEASKGFVHGSLMGISLLAIGIFMNMGEVSCSPGNSGFVCKISGAMQIAATGFTLFFACRMLNNLKTLYDPDNARRVSSAKSQLNQVQGEIAQLSQMIQSVLNRTLDLSAQDREHIYHRFTALRAEEGRILEKM